MISWTADPFELNSPETAVLEYAHKWKHVTEREPACPPLTFKDLDEQLASTPTQSRRLGLAVKRLGQGGNLRKVRKLGNQVLWVFYAWGGYGACTCDACRVRQGSPSK